MMKIKATARAFVLATVFGAAATSHADDTEAQAQRFMHECKERDQDSDRLNDMTQNVIEDLLLEEEFADKDPADLDGLARDIAKTRLCELEYRQNMEDEFGGDGAGCAAGCVPPAP